jgi:hypothetical protein
LAIKSKNKTKIPFWNCTTVNEGACHAMKPREQSTLLEERHSSNELRDICSRAENLDKPNILLFDSFEQFTKSRIGGIKVDVHERWKSLTSEFTKFEALLYINVCWVVSNIDNNNKKCKTIK